VSFAFKEAAIKLKPKLDAAGVTITVYENRFRISPSVYNDMNDIDRLIAALS
jgi:selenocysteine lyase/cysteine desulfurase